MCIRLQLQRSQDAHKENLLCRFSNDIYKLKKSPRSQYIKIDKYLTRYRFRRSPYGLNIYVKISSQGIFILVVYVENFIIKRSEASVIREIKSQSCTSFDASNVGLLHFCLGLEFWYSYNGVIVSQTKHVKSILEKFSLFECKQIHLQRLIFEIITNN